MIEYRLALAERSTTGLGAEIIPDVFELIGDINNSGLTYTEELNGVGTLEFTLPLDHSSVTTDNFDIGGREMYLYRNGGSGEVLVFGGKLWTVDIDGLTGRFLCYDFSHDLERRIVHDDYATQERDTFDIVWDLVTDTQNRPDGALGITRDFTTRGHDRRFVVCVEERRTVLDCIQELSGAKQSFDFRVSPDKKLQLFSDHRGIDTIVTFNDENMSEFRHQRDATNIETVVAAIGPIDDCSTPSVYETTSPSITKYGVLDGTVENDQIRDDDIREDTADKQVRENTVPRFQPDVTLETPLQDWNVDTATGYDVQFEDVNVGDTAGVSTSDAYGVVGGFRNFNQTFRVVSKTVDVKRIGFETVTFGLDQILPTGDVMF